MTTYSNKMVNGVAVPLTQNEIAELEARDAAWDGRQVEPQVDPVEKLRRFLLANRDVLDAIVQMVK